MFGGRLARSAADAANSLFLTRFAKRVEIAGKKSGEVNESYTTVTCRKCGCTKPMPLKIRVYECLMCDHIEDRDVNRSIQIAFRDILEDKKEKKNAAIVNKSQENGELSRRKMKSGENVLRDF